MTLSESAPSVNPGVNTSPSGLPANTPLHLAALAYAEAGLKIFPCGRDKKPLTPHGFKDATTDPGQITVWWHKWPEANVAFSPGDHGLAFIDLDSHAADFDPGAVAALELPATYDVSTPSGGQHRLFKGILPSIWRKLGGGIDVRSFGAYVLLPPFRTGNGVYTALPGFLDALALRLFSELPGTVTARAAVRPAPGNHGTAPDLLANIERDKASLGERIARGDFAIQGEAGSNPMLEVFCDCVRLALSYERAREITAPWRAQCRPPWG